MVNINRYDSGRMQHTAQQHKKTSNINLFRSPFPSCAALAEECEKKISYKTQKSFRKIFLCRCIRNVFSRYVLNLEVKSTDKQKMFANQQTTSQEIFGAELGHFLIIKIFLELIFGRLVELIDWPLRSVLIRAKIFRIS